MKQFFRDFWAVQEPASSRERWRVFLGVSLGLLVTALMSRFLLSAFSTNTESASLLSTWLVAPIGASAILVFATPASPFAQPWAVLAGNTLSALVGVVCANYVGEPTLAATLAVGIATGLMLLLRCLHPPGGAIALLAVMLHVTHYQFVLFPVLVNGIFIVATGVFFNRLSGKRYPKSLGT